MKITYLLGAGASANSVPTSKSFTKHLKKFLSDISVETGKLPSPSEVFDQKNFEEVTARMVAETSVLLPELEEHTNVDVYGRQLYLTGQTAKLRQLKALVSAFLIMHQLENKPDKRYDHFMANILERNEKGEINFPMELLLLSWNYDFQLELAAANYMRQYELDKLQEQLNFYPRVQIQDLEREMLNKFSVIKLNGTVGGSLPDENNFLPLSLLLNPDVTTPADVLHKKRLGEAVLHYNRHTDTKSTAISDIMYAWEISPIQKRMKSYLKYKSYNTDVLVIVGYSFPTFNRRFDKELLANMQLLKEVCIQAPSDTINGIAERFTAVLGPERVLGQGKSSNPVRVRLIEMKDEKLEDEFYVPFQATTF